MATKHADTTLATAVRQSRVHVIEPRRQGALARAADFWRYRRLIPYFGRGFVKKRYQRTWLGKWWLFIRPVADIGARVLVFGGVLGISVGPAPYLLVFIIASSAWEVFAQTAFWATRSLEMSRRELRTVYLPRLIPLTGATFPALVDYAIYAGITAVVLVYYRIADGRFYLEIGPQTPLLLAGLVLLLILGLGIGLWTAPFAVHARDVRFTLAFVLGFWYFLTPVIYPVDAIPEEYRFLADLNPVTAPIEMIKRGLLGFGDLSASGIGITLGVIALLYLGGLRSYARRESLALDGL